MTNFDPDDLPPDLAHLGERMRDERPVADDTTLERMMQRAGGPGLRTSRRVPRRAFAVSLATVLAMVSVTGVAAAALFGMNFGLLGKALTISTDRVGAASNQALQAPARWSNPARRPSSGGAVLPASPGGSALPASSDGSVLGGLGSLSGQRPGAGGLAAGGSALAPAVASGPSANFHIGFGDAGDAQYRARLLVCRILRALGLDFVARLLGC